jgi:hypothetical protein
MKIKEGVKLQGLRLVMRPVLIAAEEAWQANGQELVVTSTTEGTHSAGSLHPYGYAVDFRTRYFSNAEKRNVVQLLHDKLVKYGGMYRIITHNTHIHVEFRHAVKYIEQGRAWI